MPTAYRYQVVSHWTMHKRGIVEAPDVPRTINFSAPPEFGGEPGLWTPEHMLVAAVATCFTATFRVLAERSKLEVHALEVPVEGVLEREEKGYRFTEILLRPQVTILKESDRVRTLLLVEKAEKACLVSRSLNSKITLSPKVVVETAVPAL